MTWSFSRLNAYHQCPYGWKLHYLDDVAQVGSGFADWGSLCHSIFEDYEKGNLADFELLDAYEERYPQYMQNDFPPIRGIPMADRYYERGRELFASFPGFPENWEVLGVELRVDFEIDGNQFVGFIDLLVRDKEDGRLIVIDHKSKSKFKSPEEQAHYAIQLYLYAYWVYLHYGERCKELIFDMFRAGNMVRIPYRQEDQDAAIEWFLDTIRQIYQDEAFESAPLQTLAAMNAAAPGSRQQRYFESQLKSAQWFCHFLCSSRLECSDWMKGE